MSNEQMREALIARAKAKLRWDRDNLGGVQFIGVSDNDQASAVGACECDKCTAARKLDAGPGVWNQTNDPGGLHAGEVGWGGQSGLSLSVANQLAVSLEEEFPDVKVMVQSYQDKNIPPTVTQPHRNVWVQFAELGQNFGQPLTHPSNVKTLAQLQAWAKIMPGRISIW